MKCPNCGKHELVHVGLTELRCVYGCGYMTTQAELEKEEEDKEE